MNVSSILSIIFSQHIEINCFQWQLYDDDGEISAEWYVLSGPQ